MMRLPTTLTKRDYEILANFRARLRNFLHFSEEEARREGLTPQQHQLLLAVQGSPGRTWATVSELSECLQVKNHSTVGLINRMVEVGLVCRRKSEADHRSTEIHVTPRGEELLNRLTVAHRRELLELSAEIREMLGELEDIGR